MENIKLCDMKWYGEFTRLPQVKANYVLEIKYTKYMIQSFQMFFQTCLT